MLLGIIGIGFILWGFGTGFGIRENNRAQIFQEACKYISKSCCHYSQYHNGRISIFLNGKPFTNRVCRGALSCDGAWQRTGKYRSR